MKKAARSLRLGASITALTMAMIAGQAQAQETTTDGEEVEAVVVTGFRSSLDKALNVKRSEAAAVDSILAEDIGKFPDLNLSESIQRIPGVAITRDGGEGRQISVRGLGPQFTRVRINGMEALTTGGSADSSGGTNRGRSFDFNVFASDLFNSIRSARRPRPRRKKARSARRSTCARLARSTITASPWPLRPWPATTTCPRRSARAAPS